MKDPKTYIVGIHGPARSGKGTAAKALLDRKNFTQVDFADELRRKLVCLFPMYTQTAGGWDLSKAVWEDSCKGDTVEIFDSLRPYIAAVLAEDVGSDLALDFDAWLYENPNPTIRQLLQRLGTEVYRAKKPKMWVSSWYDSVYWLRTKGGTYRREYGTVTIDHQEVFRYGKLDREFSTAVPQNIVTSDVRFDNEADYIRNITAHNEGRRGMIIELNAPWVKEPKDGLEGHQSNQTLANKYIDDVVDIPQAAWHVNGTKPSSEEYEEWASEVRGKFLLAVDNFIERNP